MCLWCVSLLDQLLCIDAKVVPVFIALELPKCVKKLTPSAVPFTAWEWDKNTIGLLANMQAAAAGGTPTKSSLISSIFKKKKKGNKQVCLAAWSWSANARGQCTHEHIDDNLNMVVTQASVNSYTFDHLFDPETENVVVYEVLVACRTDLLPWNAINKCTNEYGTSVLFDLSFHSIYATSAVFLPPVNSCCCREWGRSSSSQRWQDCILQSLRSWGVNWHLRLDFRGNNCASKGT